MKEFKVSTIDSCRTCNVERMHQVYQDHKGKPVKLVRYGDSINIGDTPIGETVLVMAWDTTEIRGDYKITINSYQRVN